MFSYKQNIQTINLDRVKYLTMVKISELLIEKGAIIFGGFVRDKLIHDHYANLYYQNKMGCDSKYSDENHNPETKHRLLVPNDIDVFVRGTEEKIEEVYSYLKTNGFEVEIKIRKKIYGAFDNINQQKIVVKTKNFCGLPTIKIDLDILYSSDDAVKPPFKRLDLWCNSLLMDKNGITVSDQTGSRIDHFNLFERKLVEIEIIKDLTNFKTKEVNVLENIFGDEESIVKPDKKETVFMNGVFCPLINEKIITKRIKGMKKRGWEITGTM